MYQKLQETAPTSMGFDVPDSKRFKTEDCSQENERDIQGVWSQNAIM